MLKIDRQKHLDEELHTYGSILISTMSQKLRNDSKGFKGNGSAEQAEAYPWWSIPAGCR